MKTIYKLILSIIFFILGMYVATWIPKIEMTCASQPAPAISVGLTTLIIFLFGLALWFAMSWSRDTFCENKKQTIIGVIPARMASTRFPGKPLAKINDIPMIQYVYESCKKAKILNDVYIATPDTEIMEFCATIDAVGILTSDKHERASDRVVEAIQRLPYFEKIDIVVMIQGDEPMITPEMIDEAIQPILKGEAEVTNLMYPIETVKEKNDRNTIKVVTDLESNALYFSRSLIPNTNMIFKYYKQVCVIAFTRNALLQYETFGLSELEKAESIDMLRFLEHGIKVKMIKTQISTHSVDTPEDLKLVEKLMKK